MISIPGTTEWRTLHPAAVIGLMELSGVDNTQPCPQLNQRKRQTEGHLRNDFAGFNRQDFLALPVMAAYQRYYKRFSKNYHVLLQVESLVLKGKSLPDVSPLVDANFIAEVDTLVLTAGHDADRLELPVWIDVSRPGDVMALMSGETRPIQAGDMAMRDAHGVCCTILYGQDNRSPITTETQHVLYVSYAPAGVPGEVVETHLKQVEQNVRLFAPQASLEQFQLLST